MLFVTVLLAPALRGQGPVPGDNINMVGGTEWPGGDPFLQRQNEPSLAVSSKNTLHLLAGANDYRTVDLPVSDTLPGTLAGDAWLGVFKSFDGGQSWQSTLLPGYSQDSSPEGLASPIKGFTAAADPTVRAGTNGLFYYSGIAFNRGTNQGAVFVSRLLDSNSKENGDATQGQDAIRYVDTVVVDTGTSGQFLDKPWIAVDIPRSGAGTCTFTLSPTQTFPAGNVYLVWSRFTGSTSTKIMFSRSLDCGKTWSNPIKLSESNSVNQGTTVGIDPKTGAIHAAWRRFASSSQPDAIVSAKSTDFGNTFPSKNTKNVATILPFDQGTSATSFRTNALPTIAVSVDGSNVSRVHVAWAARAAAGGDAKVFLATSSNGVNWGVPAAVDTAPIADDYGGSFAAGHRFMPQLTFTAGRLMLVYYDQRLDHTLSLFTPNNPFAPDAQGRFYLIKRDKRGELITNPSSVFTLFIDDAGLTQRRHTVDLRVAQAIPGPSLSFASATVSRYRLGLRADLKDEAGQPLPQPIQFLAQLQANPPNLPLFQQGTLPFLGDYIDIAGQTFLPPSTPGGPWIFNTAAAKAPVHYAVWTDNRDIHPPADGNWTNYTPVGGGGLSVFDPSQNTPACVSGQEGMRNQNIYSSRITDGLLVFSPQNVKPLSPSLARAFVVTVQNSTGLDRTFRMTIGGQPAGGAASFLQGSLLASLEVGIGAHSGAARPVFATSTNPAASIAVNVDEISGPGGAVIAGGLSGFVVLNPEGSVTALTQPDGSSDPIGSAEVYTPEFSFINISNVNPFINISNPNEEINISNINISNPDVAVINISNSNEVINISNINISNPDPAVINISNINISNTTEANINISNPNISNINISNTALSDATYLVSNSGNTTHSYHVALLGNAPPSTQLQLILNKTYAAPASVNCALQQQLQKGLLANVNDPFVTASLAQATDPNIADPELTNATLALAPGESAFVTVRAGLDAAAMAQLVTQMTPVITAHGANTGDSASKFAALLFVTTGDAALPAAVVGMPYSATLEAFGGTAPYLWSLTSGSLPPGLTISSSGQITGIPSEAGVFGFTAQVSDSSSPQQTSTRVLSLTVTGRAVTTAVGLGTNPVVVGQGSLVTVTVTDVEPAGAKLPPAGTVTISGGASVSGGTCLLAASGTDAASCSVTVTASAAGAHNVSASYPGSNVHQAGSASAILTANTRATAAAVSFSANPLLAGQAGLVTVTVTDIESAGPKSSPTGTVVVGSSVAGDVFSPASSCTLAPAGADSASCSLTLTASATGPRTISASYPGTSVHSATSAGAGLTVKANTTTAITSDAPDPSVAGQSVTVAFSVAAVPPASGTPSGTVTVTDGFGAICAGTLTSGSGNCSLTLTTVGTVTLTAVYSAQGDFNASSGTAPHVVEAAPAFYTFLGFETPMTTAGTFSAPTFSGTFNLGRAVPIKWQLFSASGARVTSLTSTTSLKAIFNTACSGAPNGTEILLYMPTVGATGGSTFRSSSSGFIFNWDTSTGVPTGAGCYTIVLQLDDGSEAKATTVRLQ